jgi:hypothetical protein
MALNYKEGKPQDSVSIAFGHKIGRGAIRQLIASVGNE